MFQFRRFPSYTYGFSIRYMSFSHVDCSIRISAGHSSLTTLRSFSQLTTSFFGSQCQGIRPALFLALPFALHLEYLKLLYNCSFPDLRLFLKIVSFHLIVFLSVFNFQVSFPSVLSPEGSSVPFENRNKQIISFIIYLFTLSISFRSFGGHKWTRTTDLTLIRRAL